MAARIIVFVAVVTAFVASVRPAAAQAWVLPARTGAVTVVLQEIDHVGRMRNDGTRIEAGKAVNFAFDVELDYAFTDRFSMSTTLPYILSRFTDTPKDGPCDTKGTADLSDDICIPLAAVDECRCWQSSFADFGVTARYNLINHNQVFLLTPSVSVGVPSHNYEYVGEAVVGRQLNELRIAVDAGQRLDRLLRGLSVQAGYRYSFVEQSLDVPNNRSNGLAQAAFAFPSGFSARGVFSWQRTHGGLRVPEFIDPSNPQYPELQKEFHRMLRDNYLHIGAGAAYVWGSWDISGSFLLTAKGSNSHDVRVYSVTVGRSFEIPGTGRP
jgi:hypothetical protein